MGKKKKKFEDEFPKGFLYKGSCHAFSGHVSEVAVKKTKKFCKELKDSWVSRGHGWRFHEDVRETLKNGKPELTLEHSNYAELYKAVKEGQFKVPKCVKFIKGVDALGKEIIIPLARDAETKEFIEAREDFVDTDGFSSYDAQPFTTVSHTCTADEQVICGYTFVRQYALERVELADTLEVNLDDSSYEQAIEDIGEGFWEEVEYDEEDKYPDGLDDERANRDLIKKLRALDRNYWKYPCLFRGCPNLKEVVVGSLITMKMGEDAELGRPEGKCRNFMTRTKRDSKELQRLLGCPKGCVIKVRGTDIKIVCDEPVEPDWVSEVSYIV